MVSYSKINWKAQRNERQSRYERAELIISEQADQIMNGAIRVEQIRDGESRLENTELSVMLRLEQSGVKESGEKTWRIGAEREHHGEIEKSRVKR